MRWITKRTALCAVVVGIAALVVGALPTGTAGAAVPQDCTPWTVIGLAGSSELNAVTDRTPSNLLGGTVSSFVDELQRGLDIDGELVTRIGVDYRAAEVEALLVSPSDYFRSVAEGRAKFLDAVQKFMSGPCARRSGLVVAGYSQGAWSLHLALAALTDAEAAAIDGVVLIGDPLQVPFASPNAGFPQVRTAGFVTSVQDPRKSLDPAAVRDAAAAFTWLLAPPLFAGALWPQPPRLTAATLRAAFTKYDIAQPKPYVPKALAARTVVVCAAADVMCSPAGLPDKILQAIVSGGNPSLVLQTHQRYTGSPELGEGALATARLLAPQAPKIRTPRFTVDRVCRTSTGIVATFALDRTGASAQVNLAGRVVAYVPSIYIIGTGGSWTMRDWSAKAVGSTIHGDAVFSGSFRAGQKLTFRALADDPGDRTFDPDPADDRATVEKCDVAPHAWFAALGDARTRSISLDGSESVGNRLVAYRWLLRDSNGRTIAVNGRQVTVTGLVPGTYRVQLRVVDSRGNDSTMTRTVRMR